MAKKENPKLEAATIQDVGGESAKKPTRNLARFLVLPFAQHADETRENIDVG